jgi:hypothetical protein
MEEELVGKIFEAMMISASGEGFVPFSATRGGRVAKYVKIWAFAGSYQVAKISAQLSLDHNLIHFLSSAQ